LLAIIQARTSSARFPKKILTRIYGKTIIEHVVLKIKKSKKIKTLIVATSANKSDDMLVDHLKQKNIDYFRGSLKNVALRLLQVALKYKQKYFIRISGDSPLIDYKIINRSINLLKKKRKVDILTNVFPRTFPSGQSVEIINANSLKKNLKKMSKFDLEHVTTYFYKNSHMFLIKNFKTKLNNNNIKLSIDTKQDLKVILKKIKKNFFFNFSLKK